MFSSKPGMRERHLRRKYQNPLFGDLTITAADIEQAQQQDEDEVNQFLNHFRDLVQQSVELDPNADPDVVLKLKEMLDKSYEQCAGLVGDQEELKGMIKRLLQSIMQAMWKGVGEDAQAQSKLRDEEQARQAHFSLLEYPLVGDLIRPDSVIDESELVAVLLSESADNVRMAMQLFNPEQQVILCQQAVELIERLAQDGSVPETARQRLAEMESLLTVASSRPS